MTTAYKMVIDGSVQVNALSLWFKGGRWAHAFYGSEAPATVPLPHRSVYACIILCDQARCVHAAPTAKMVEQVCSMTCKCAVFLKTTRYFRARTLQFWVQKRNIFHHCLYIPFFEQDVVCLKTWCVLWEGGRHYYVLKGYHAIEGRGMQWHVKNVVVSCSQAQSSLPCFTVIVFGQLHCHQHPLSWCQPRGIVFARA